MAKRTIHHSFFILLFLVAAFLFGKIFWPFLVPFVLGIILVSVFYPWYKKMLVRLKSVNLASLLMCLIIVLIVIVPLGILLGLVSKEAFQLFVWAKDRLQTESVRSFLENNKFVSTQVSSLQTTLNIDLSPEKIRDQLGAVGKNIGYLIYTEARRITSNIFTVVFNFFLLIFILFYLFRDGKEILKKIMYLSPLSEENEWLIIKKIEKVGSAVFWGNLMAAFFQGVAGGIGFFLFGLGNGMLIGLATALLSLIPAVGTLIVYLPAALYFFATNHTPLALGIFIYGVLLSNIIDNIIKPKLIENKIQIHPLLVFFSILGGVQVFGLLGILYGPMIVTFFLSIMDIYKSDFIKDA